jgi:hypothetical protein
MLMQILIISCQEGVINREQKKHTNHCKLIVHGIKEFPLDEESTYLTNYIQLIDNDISFNFSFVNSYNNSIYFYDYESSSFIKKIKYEKEGPDGVMNVQGFLYMNEDSIFIYSYNLQTLFLTDAKSKVLDKFKLYETPDSWDIILPSPYVQTMTPILKHNHNLFLFGFVTGETNIETEDNRPVCIRLNITTKIQEHFISYPYQYVQYNWAGGFTYRIPYADMNKNSIFVSFAADHDINGYSFSDKLQTQFYAGSSLINTIKPFSESKRSPIDENQAWKWYLENPSYEGILYDKYKNLYYRIARLPQKDYNLNEKGNHKPIIITVLNENLEYLGEVKLPENINFRTSCCFISKDGFNIQVITDDEDKMTFYQYNFLDNEK